MISLHVLLIIFIVLFGIIGSMRGWAKEVLVTFSIILAMFSLTVFENYITFFKETIKTATPATVFWIRSAILAGLVFFGYETPKIPRLADTGKFIRNVLQDTLLGGFLGMVNGFLVIGSIWYFLHTADYPFSFVTAPDATTVNGLASLNWVQFLPPSWLMTTPAIYVAVAVCFVIVLVVFI
jgi:uncharacterized membrane protein required for colicin V production